MKNQLGYQTSEYDCGPTTLVNAFRFLFHREEILPELIKTISLYTLDLYDKDGECGKSGTSRMAMMFLSEWFNHFSMTKKFPIHTELLLDEQVWMGPNSSIYECLKQNGTVILCVWLDVCKHYILLTGINGDYIEVFDPYDWDEPVDGIRIKKIEGAPKSKNREALIEIFNQEDHGFYALGEKNQREAMLLYNTNIWKNQENFVEYII